MDKQKKIKISLVAVIGILLTIAIVVIIALLILSNKTKTSNVEKENNKEVSIEKNEKETKEKVENKTEKNRKKDDNNDNEEIMIKKDDEEIADFIEKYLNKKYGKHKFKVTSVDYDYKRGDYSNPSGYIVSFTCDVVEDSSVFIEGTDLNKAKISDSLLEDYYFPNQESYEKVKNFYEIAPEADVEELLTKKFKKEFDSECKKIEISRYYITIPEDYGDIPSLEEVKEDLSLFDANEIRITLSKAPENPEEYKEDLKEYLESTFGGEWEITGNATDRISCRGETFNLSLLADE